MEKQKLENNKCLKISKAIVCLIAFVAIAILLNFTRL